jgi:hypothetical protein
MLFERACAWGNGGSRSRVNHAGRGERQGASPRGLQGAGTDCCRLGSAPGTCDPPRGDWPENLASSAPVPELNTRPFEPQNYRNEECTQSVAAAQVAASPHEPISWPGWAFPNAVEVGAGARLIPHQVLFVRSSPVPTLARRGTRPAVRSPLAVTASAVMTVRRRSRSRAEAYRQRPRDCRLARARGVHKTRTQNRRRRQGRGKGGRRRPWPNLLADGEHNGTCECERAATNSVPLWSQCSDQYLRQHPAGMDGPTKQWSFDPKEGLAEGGARLTRACKRQPSLTGISFRLSKRPMAYHQALAANCSRIYETAATTRATSPADQPGSVERPPK